MNIIKYFRYLLEASIGLNILIFCKVLGINTSAKLLGFLASFVGPNLGISRRAYINLDLAISELSTEKKTEIVKNMWKNLGMTSAEFFNLSKLSKESNERIEIEGIEIAKKYVQEGAIFISAHKANWEVIPIAIKKSGGSVAAIYRNSNNFFVNNWMINQRKKITKNQIAKGPGGAREMLRFLEKRGNIAMLVDQKLSSGVKVDFFGVSAMTSDAPATFSLKYGFPVIPMSVERKEGSSFKVRFYPKIEIETSQNRQKDILIFTSKINEFLERIIKEKPHEWFWLHNRWDKRFQ